MFEPAEQLAMANDKLAAPFDVARLTSLDGWELEDERAAAFANELHSWSASSSCPSPQLLLATPPPRTTTWTVSR